MPTVQQRTSGALGEGATRVRTHRPLEDHEGNPNEGRKFAQQELREHASEIHRSWRDCV